MAILAWLEAEMGTKTNPGPYSQWQASLVAGTCIKPRILLFRGRCIPSSGASAGKTEVHFRNTFNKRNSRVCRRDAVQIRFGVPGFPKMQLFLPMNVALLTPRLSFLRSFQDTVWLATTQEQRSISRLHSNPEHGTPFQKERSREQIPQCSQSGAWKADPLARHKKRSRLTCIKSLNAWKRILKVCRIVPFEKLGLYLWVWNWSEMVSIQEHAKEFRLLPSRRRKLFLPRIRATSQDSMTDAASHGTENHEGTFNTHASKIPRFN
ncbi:hypothetical protein BT63DRAFT_450111 [Microthyrium microscopicum]|uniref:Uncharacterized protein n=1 Tax=Microthyrium microscopicum TaxID=703497 RepID=A0A6A6UUN4_9PEZI|nr:hypothetical protein BT63DRAFT_450111 [Microthyrium microscopicum]